MDHRGIRIALNEPLNPIIQQVKDDWNLAYSIYFILGMGLLLPWNAFITAIDYFSYLYPSAHVERVLTLTLTGFALAVLGMLLAGGTKAKSVSMRVNFGWVLFLFSLIGVVLFDVFYVKGERGVYGAYYATVAAVALCGIAQGLVQGSLVGFAGELPTRFMQGLVAGTSASGVLVSIMRTVSKTMYTKDPHGLRSSAILYFGMSIAVMLLCLVSFNLANNLHIIKYYKSLKCEAIVTARKISPPLSLWWKTNQQVWYIGYGIILTFTITFSIYPGPVVEDVHSVGLKDWYPIIHITCFNIFDLIGKCITAFYVVENTNVAIVGAFGRLLFYPLFLVCLHGPMLFRTEIPLVILTCLLGLTNGYFQCLFFILSPKVVDVEHAEVNGVAMVMFLIMGIVVGTTLSWLWLI